MAGNPPLYFVTTGSRESGEWVTCEQLACLAGGTAVDHVPGDGDIVYLLNINLGFQPGSPIVMHMTDLSRSRFRKGFVVGVLRGWDEIEVWRPLFVALRRMTDIFFCSPDQIKYLSEFGIAPTAIVYGEDQFRGTAEVVPDTVLYTGFYWPEKDMPMFARVASLLPGMRFTAQIGMNAQIRQTGFPSNVSFETRFIPPSEYLAYLATFEYIWIPRRRSPWVYSGRSGASAIASLRPTILTDVNVNDFIPSGACIKYPADASAEEIAALIASRPKPDLRSVEAFLDASAPARTAELIRSRMRG